MKDLNRIVLVRSTTTPDLQENAAGSIVTLHADLAGNAFVIPSAYGPGGGGDPFDINQIQLSTDNQSTSARGMVCASAGYLYDSVTDNWGRAYSIPDAGA